jgi:NAD(P)-dependent dehydrogenase (short-subunit alcohol dehydrogenase family)
VADDAALAAALESALGTAPVGLLVHAAGVLELAPLDRLGTEALRRMLEVNVVGTANVVRTLLPRLSATRGHVALVASVAGLFPLPGGFTGYGASKYAVRGWAEIARPELLARGVTLTVAYPSILDTPMVRALGPDAPPVYRAFPWHPPERAAARLVDDALTGRLESYAAPTDRLAGWLAGAFPHLFARGLAALVRLRGR